MPKDDGTSFTIGCTGTIKHPPRSNASGNRSCQRPERRPRPHLGTLRGASHTRIHEVRAKHGSWAFPWSRLPNSTMRRRLHHCAWWSSPTSHSACNLFCPRKRRAPQVQDSEERFDYAVVAVPFDSLAKLLPDSSDSHDLREKLSHFETRPSRESISGSTAKSRLCRTPSS